MTLTYPDPLAELKHGLFQFFAPLFTLFASFKDGEDDAPDNDSADDVIDEDEPDEGEIIIDEESDDYISDDDEEPEDDKEDRKARNKVERRRQKIEKGLYGKDDDEDESGEEDEDEEPDPKPKKKGEGSEKPKPKVPAKKADGDIDYEADDLEEEEESDDADEEDDDDLDPNEKGPVAEAKRNGRKLKEINHKLAERELELTTAKKELQEANERLTEYSKVKVNPREHPDYVDLNKKIWADVDVAMDEELPETCKNFDKSFNSYVGKYIDATLKPRAERTAALADLKKQMVDDHGGFPEKYDDMDEDDRQIADALSKQMLGVVTRNKSRVEELNGIETKIKKDAEAGKISINAKDYSRSKTEFDEFIRGVGNMDEKLVKDAPYTPEAAITQLVKSDPAMAKRLESAKEDLREVVVGLRPLTAAEYDNLEGQGITVKDYLRERKKRHEEKKKALLPLMLRGLMTANITKKALENLVREQVKGQDNKDELEALGKLDRQKRLKQTEEKKPKREGGDPRRRESAISKYL